jgi:hypothetical protein
MFFIFSSLYIDKNKKLPFTRYSIGVQAMRLLQLQGEISFYSAGAGRNKRLCRISEDYGSADYPLDF